MTANNPNVRDNLIPFNKMPKSQHLQMSKNGGKSKSVFKSEMAKLRHIKERIAKQIANQEDVDWMLMKLHDRPSMAAQLLLTVEELRKQGIAFPPREKVAIAKIENDAAKFIHGEKIETKNVNINVNTSMEEFEKRLLGVIDGESVQDLSEDEG